MKPFPTQSADVIEVRESAVPMPPPALVAPAAGSYSASNRRAASCPLQRVYPLLLFISTAIAGVFCLMYSTKPVIETNDARNPADRGIDILLSAKAPLSRPILMPNKGSLPGERPAEPSIESPGSPVGTTSLATAFEQTNIRIQHILTAKAPGGYLSKIDIEVPVLYQSRSLRWTAEEVARARDLLVRLANYQEKSQILRSEGAELLDSWNRLIESSTPAGDLRADSPTLPANQQDAINVPRPSGLDTTELIKIQPAGK